MVTPTWGDGSVIELPDALQMSGHAIRYDVPRGTVIERTFKSEHLGNERTIWIYTPAGFSDAEGTFPLLVQFDGDRCLDVHNLPAMLDSLIADGEIPPIVAVMVATVDRNTELPCNQAMADALADELIPMLRQEFRIGEGPESVVAAGQSYGGLAAVWVALRRPDAIGNAHRHMRDVLIARGYDVAYREYPGGHDFYVWRGLFPDGLKHLLASS